MKGLIVLVVFSVLLLFPLGQLAYATHVSPDFIQGNPKCPNSLTSFKIENVPDFDGVFTDGGLSVTITLSSSPDESPFDWSSNIGVSQVIAKGGPNGNVYNFNPISTGDTGFETPTNPNNNKLYGISHIDFCYNEPIIGGKLIPVDTTALLLVGAQSTASWLIPVIAAGMGIGIVLVKRK